MPKERKKPIGGLWKKTSQNGEFLSGNIEINGNKISIVAFANRYKEGKQPDYRIFESEPYTPRREPGDEETAF